VVVWGKEGGQKRSKKILLVLLLLIKIEGNRFSVQFIMLANLVLGDAGECFLNTEFWQNNYFGASRKRQYSNSNEAVGMREWEKREHDTLLIWSMEFVVFHYASEINSKL